LPTLFTLVEFELHIFSCDGPQGGLLDGDPEKSILTTGPRGLNPGGLFTGFRGWAWLVFAHWPGHTYLFLCFEILSIK
jgi:hypothetical protein